MAIPGTVMFTLAGITGQFVSNALDRWRVYYIFKHEDEWRDSKPSKSKEEISREKLAEYEYKFGIFEQFGLKKPDFEKRIARLKGEIEKLDVMMKKVDDEIATLEKAASISDGGKKGIPSSRLQ